MNSAPQKLTIFLCHASEDKPKVRELYMQLINDGYDVWLDEEKLIPGHDWRNEITKAVRASNVVIVCLSRKSINKEGFVQKEISFALDVAEEKPENTIFIIPAKLEKCKVPDRLSRWQWVDLFLENGYKKLKQALDLRYENLYKRKHRIKRPLNLSKEEINQSITSNLVSSVAVDDTLPLDEKVEKIPDDTKSKIPSVALPPFQGQKNKTRTKSGILVTSFLTLGSLFVFFVILVLVIAVTNLNGIRSALTPNLQPTRALTILSSPTSSSPPTPSLSTKEYFTEEFDGDISNWSYFTSKNDPKADDSGVDPHTENGFLVFDLAKNLNVDVMYDPYTYSNVRVDARVENRGTNNNNINLVCRYSDKGWYEVAIANNGLYWLFAYDGVKGTYAQLTNGGSNKINAGKEVNEYTFICNDRNLIIQINGFDTKTYTDNQYVFRDGQVGVGASSFDDIPVKVEYDWVKISEP